MKFKLRKFGLTIVIALLTCSLLTQCVSTVDGVPTTQNEVKTVRQATVVHGAAGAALAGALAYGVAKLDGASDEAALKAGLVGVAAGGLAGSQVGMQKGRQAVREKRFVKLEKTRLDTLLAEASAKNQEYAAYNKRLQGTISTLSEEKNNLSSKKLERTFEKRVKAEINGAAYAQNQLVVYIDEGTKLTGQLEPNQASALQRQIDNSKEELDDLNQALSALKGLDERVAVDTSPTEG